MLSRTGIIVRFCILVASGIGYLIALASTDYGSPLQWIMMIIMLVVSIVHHICTRCPHCGRTGTLKIRLLAHNAGHCRCCGKLVEYKECCDK